MQLFPKKCKEETDNLLKKRARPVKLNKKGNVFLLCLFKETDVKLKNEMRESKKFTLRSITDTLPDKALKNILGGYGGDCWSFTCLVPPCDNPGPCPGDMTGTCYGPSSWCYDSLESSCFSFTMEPC